MHVLYHFPFQVFLAGQCISLGLSCAHFVAAYGSRIGCWNNYLLQVSIGRGYWGDEQNTIVFLNVKFLL